MTELHVQSRPRARRNACADAALRAEIRRVEGMTIEQRMRAALTLGKGVSKILTVDQPKNIHGDG